MRDGVDEKSSKLKVPLEETAPDAFVSGAVAGAAMGSVVGLIVPFLGPLVGSISGAVIGGFTGFAANTAIARHRG